MRQIYLVRHGVIDYKSLGLASEGLAYARRLPDLLPDPIDFLASDEEARCVATMEPLASKRSLILRKYAKARFTSSAPLVDAPRQGVSVICYRIESVNAMLVQLGFPPFNDVTRDSSYEQILVYTDNANTVSRKTIPTGQKRPPRR
jgi:hypothetical protein